MMKRHDSKQARAAIVAARSKAASAAGFTLLELIVVVSIIALLAAIALPAYNDSIVKTRRKAAEACLSQYANYMERYYTTNMSYAADTAGNANSLPTLDCNTTAQTANYYQYKLPSANLTSIKYLLQAIPQGSQASGDTLCATLQLDQAGSRTISGGTGTVAKCW
jgi:type IV pilus assembly protein PilE